MWDLCTSFYYLPMESGRGWTVQKYGCMPDLCQGEAQLLAQSLWSGMLTHSPCRSRTSVRHVFSISSSAYLSKRVIPLWLSRARLRPVRSIGSGMHRIKTERFVIQGVSLHIHMTNSLSIPSPVTELECSNISVHTCWNDCIVLARSQ
jgi:hypothetical protein